MREVASLDLGQHNTPLEPLNNISADTGVDLYVKRDDLNGLGLGGNKLRKLAYLLPQAIEQKCDVLLTYGGIQTNHGRLTAAVAAKFGLKCAIIMTGKPPEKATGNLILDRMMGADLYFMDISAFQEEGDFLQRYASLTEETTARVIKIYEDRFEKVYIIPMGGSSELGSLGYVDCAREIAVQADSEGLEMDYLICAYGSLGTYGGLLLGSKLACKKTKVIGMNVLHDFDSSPGLIRDHLSHINGISETYDMGITLQEKDLWIEKDALGKGYNIPDAKTREAVYYAARREALILDGCYTGKAFSRLLSLIESGVIPRGSRVTFLHTGGAPGLFSEGHTDSMQEELWGFKKAVY